MFGRNWSTGEATIVDRRVTATTSQGAAVAHAYVADVRVAGAPAFRTTMTDPRIVGGFVGPLPGRVVPVLVDLRRQRARFPRRDPAFRFGGVTAGVRAAVGRDVFAENAAQAPGTPRR